MKTGKCLPPHSPHTKEDQFLTEVQEIVTEDPTYTNQKEILEKFREHLSSLIPNPNRRANTDLDRLN